MKKFLISLGVVLVIVGSLVMWLVGLYNRLVTGQEAVVTKWAQVESQYQRRFDLIPSLVGATKGALRQEQEVFKAIADARTHYAGTNPGSDERVKATGQVESALSRLMVIMENYPELKSNGTIRDLMTELAGTENRIQVARERYNEEVQGWNVQVKSFPTNVLAGMFNFHQKSFFESEKGSEKATTVDLTI